MEGKQPLAPGRLRTRMVSALVAIALLGSGAYLSFSYVIAERFTHAVRYPVGAAPTAATSAFEDVAFRTEDGLTLRGWYFPTRSDRAAIIVHGKDSNRIGGEHFLIEKMTDFLVATGYSVLIFDLRGSGNSDGDRFSLGYLERHDVAAAVDYVTSRGVHEDRIALIGISMGAGTVLQSLPLHPNVGAVVADSSYVDARTIVTEDLQLVAGVPSWFTPGVLLMSKLAFGLDGEQVRPVEVVRMHPERAFLFIHCDGDKLIDPHHARELRAASANPGTDLWMAAVCQHSWAFNTYPAAYEARLGAFLESQIPAHAPVASH